MRKKKGMYLDMMEREKNFWLRLKLVAIKFHSIKIRKEAELHKWFIFTTFGKPLNLNSPKKKDAQFSKFSDLNSQLMQLAGKRSSHFFCLSI